MSWISMGSGWVGVGGLIVAGALCVALLMAFADDMRGI